LQFFSDFADLAGSDLTAVDFGDGRDVRGVPVMKISATL